ncbi:MAG: SRPBCC family protein [Pseudomonadota bacterium]
MHIFKKILIGLVLLIAILAVIGFFLPSHFKVERSIEISAPPEKIYPYLEDPRAWSKWAVWNLRDPQMQVTYIGPEKGEGAKWLWKSKSEGNGGMDFVKAEPPRLIEYKLSFPDFNMSSSGKMELTPVGSATKMVWTNEGDVGANLVSRYFLLTMDSTVGGDFDTGMRNLKTLVEKN